MWAAKQITGRLVGPNEGEGGDVYGIGKEENKRVFISPNQNLGMERNDGIVELNAGSGRVPYRRVQRGTWGACGCVAWQGRRQGKRKAGSARALVVNLPT
jgi:hypothetical protein